MGLLDKFANAADKFANAGARSTMPAEKLGQHKDACQNANVHNQLAHVAANPGASRVARKAARDQLVSAYGEHEADRQIKDADRKVKDSFHR